MPERTSEQRMARRASHGRSESIHCCFLSGNQDSRFRGNDGNSDQFAVVMTEAVFVEYRVGWKSGSVRPGAFRGLHSGPGERFRSSVPLHAHADPRRIDVRASLRDPFGNIWVRDFEQKSALKVIVLADVSGSMGYVGRHDKLQQVRRIALALARTAWRNGDAFGFHAANERPQDSLTLPVRLNRGAANWLDRRLSGFSASGTSARGLRLVARQLPRGRSLVFVVSDFHWPPGDVEDLLRRLAHHAVVPIVLWDPAESQAIHRHGIAVLRDLETGARRFVWLRPGLVEALRARRRDHESKLRRTCARFGCAPFFVRDRFDAMELTRYFLETPV